LEIKNEQNIFLVIAAICTGLLIYATVFISGDLVKYLVSLQKATQLYITSTTLLALVALFAIRAYKKKRSPDRRKIAL